jgi:hypothetical protein
VFERERIREERVLRLSVEENEWVMLGVACCLEVNMSFLGLMKGKCVVVEEGVMSVLLNRLCLKWVLYKFIFT